MTSIQERFEEFHREHPEVLYYLADLALDLALKGFKHYGMRPLYERARWHFQIERGMGSDFKLNDNFISRYARKIMEDYPELAGFFETRVLKAA
jgi:hypothetical protein